MEYTIYLDALLLIAGFLVLVHLLTLWATGKILGFDLLAARLLVASVLGTIADCAVFFADLAYGGGAATRMAEAAAAVVVLALACRVAFPSASRYQLVRALGFAYLFTIISAGSSLAVYYMTGGNAWASRIASIVSLVVVMEAGWGVIQKQLLSQSLYVTVLVGVDGREVSVRALVDTGNSLRDPFSNSPVVILEFAAIDGVIPECVRSIFAGSEEDALRETGSLDRSAPWASRLRVLPYASLGREDALMMGFRPDYVRIASAAGQSVSVLNAVVGVHPRRLSPQGDYQGLVAPDVVSGALRGEGSQAS